MKPTRRQRVLAMLFEAGDRFHDGELESATEEWDATGLSVYAIEAWILADCFEPSVALRFRDNGIHPESTVPITSAGRGEYRESIAYKVSNGDLSFEDALSIIKGN